MKTFYLTFVSFFVLSSCTSDLQDMKEILTQLENMMDPFPDSPSSLLESIHYPDELNESLLADYALPSTWTRDNNYKDIAKDTLIFWIIDYFHQKRNGEKAILAAFYCGRIYQEQQNYKKALNLITDTCLQTKIDLTLAEIHEKEKMNRLELQKKYDFERIKGINNRLAIQHQWALLSISLLIIANFRFSFLFYRAKQQNKNALLEAQQTACQLKERMNDAGNTIHAFRTNQFDIVKKISLLEGYLREEEREKGKEILKKINKIIYEKDSFDWEVFYQAMNALYEGYFDKIKTAFPQLSELEYKICCLTKSELNNTEIAIILKSNVNIIQIRKTAVRKKLDIPEYGDIVKFMDTAINR